MTREKVAAINDIPAGSVFTIESNGIKIAVCNVDGNFHAIEDVCTHDGGQLDQGYLEENIITCPRHGAKFDVTNGNAVMMPAVIPVKTFRVEIEDDDIYVVTGE